MRFPKVALMGALLAFSSSTVLAQSQVPTAAAAEPLATGVLPVLDDQNRQLILHGLNNSNSDKGRTDGSSWMDATDVAHQGNTLGYNSSRFLIFWERVMPQKGVIDQGYLDQIEARLDDYTDNQMNVILDMHQDNFSRQCGDNGAPAWASQGTASGGAQGGPWWLRAASPCVVNSFNAFWGNQGNIQEYYAQAWRAVAARFHDHPAVIGYDLMNEPTQTAAIVDQVVKDLVPESDRGLLNFAVIGTIWPNGEPWNMFTDLIKSKIRDLATANGYEVPESYIWMITKTMISRNKGDWGTLTAVREFESGPLSDMYQRVINRIREVDQNNYIFVEPFSVSVNNGEPTFLRRLNDPGTNGRRLGYIPHMYPRDLHEGASYKEADFATVQRWFSNQRNYAHNNNMAWVLGEFGHSNSASGGLQFLKDALRVAEQNQLGWEYWSSDPGGWGPIASDEISDTRNAEALVRIYPRAVAGRVIAYEMDSDSKQFVLKFRNQAGVQGPTEIALPPRFFPNGITVESSDADGTWSYNHDTGRNVLELTHNPAQATHTFIVRAAGADIARYDEIRNGQSGKCLDFPGYLPGAGEQAIVYTCGNLNWQLWKYDAATQRIHSKQNSSMCLSHQGADKAVAGTPVVLAGCNNSDDQKWVRDGAYLGNAYNTSLVMGASGTGDGSGVVLQNRNGAASQFWVVNDDVRVYWSNHNEKAMDKVHGKTGRYVRVTLPGNQALSLAEVRVFDKNGNNIAQGKPAAQSTTVYGGSASRAVDGNADANWGGNSVTHTNSGPQQWWQVDLGATHDISYVEVINRSDCCRERTNGAQVHILP